MAIKNIMKFGASLVERVGEAVFLCDFKETDHKEFDSMLNVLSSPEPQYDKEAKKYQGQN